MTRTIVLATCLEKPDLIAGDRKLAAALEAFGCIVRAAPWNGPLQPFLDSDLIVIRTTWDYPKHPDAFSTWLARLGDLGAGTVNPPSLMRWNMDKRYLLDLRAKGAALPPTLISSPDAASLAETMDGLDLGEAVAKPVIGASGKGLSVMRRGDRKSLEAAAAALDGRKALVQPLLTEIRTVGEMSLVFFGGAFSHAVCKTPRPGSILVQEEHGGATVAARPGQALIAQAARILDMLPQRAIYARIDGLALDGRLVLMEAELIEPDLFLTHDVGAAARYARVLMQQLKA